jgi:hypothetical protein
MGGYSDVDSIVIAQGYWTHSHQDCLRWTAFAVRDGARRAIGSWDKASDCARGLDPGVTLAKNAMSGHEEVYARKRRKRGK